MVEIQVQNIHVEQSQLYLYHMQNLSKATLAVRVKGQNTNLEVGPSSVFR